MFIVPLHRDSKNDRTAKAQVPLDLRSTSAQPSLNLRSSFADQNRRQSLA